MGTTTQTAIKTCRLLYYGPQGAGKRDNLRLIHSSIPPEFRLSVASGDPERQIAFQVNNGDDGPWQVLVQSVDTGHERLRTAGMPDNPPFDGIIFVMSSVPGQLDAGLAAMEGLKAYLDSWDLDLMGVPVVLQYNGRESGDCLPVDRLESLLNPWGLLSYPSSSARAEGVRETLKSILGLTINHLHQKQTRTVEFESILASPADPADLSGTAPSRGREEALGVEIGPPLPGTEIEPETRSRSEAIFDELSPPLVVPVRIPRRLIQGKGPLRILLEVELEDD